MTVTDMPDTNSLFRAAALLCLMQIGALPAQAADLGAIVTEVAAHFQFPGAQLLVSMPGETGIAATGIANLATGAPVTEATRFHVASVGKILTAIATLQAIKEERLSVESPVLAFLSPEEAKRLPHIESTSISSLLSHTSGLPDCLRNGRLSVPEHPGIAWTASEALRLGWCGAATRPGAFAYSNTNYILLGHILEKVDGSPLPDILARRILAPLGMADSTAAVTASDPLLAHGYRLPTAQGGRRDASLLAWSSHLGDAPLTTTASDLLRLFNCLFHAGGAPLLPEQTVAAMSTERGREDGEGYGWGLQRVDTDQGLRLGHSGRFGGYAAEAWYYPDRDAVVILLANGDEFTKDDPMDVIEAKLFPPPATAGDSESKSPKTTAEQMPPVQR